MYHDERRQGWCEDNGTLIVHDYDLHLHRHTIHDFIRAREESVDCTILKTLLDFLRDNDGALFYDKDKDAFYLATHNNNAHQRILSVGALYTAWHPLGDSCDSSEPSGYESIRLSILSLKELETAQHGNETNLRTGH